MLLHNHPERTAWSPPPADLNVAARLHDGGIGFGIVNNDATELYVVVEVPRDRADGPASIRSRSWTRWGARDRRRRARARTRTARASGTWPPTSPTPTTTAAWSLLEAGTGIGKSFAYLVPALAWARANGERTVVSTNTINLQEQLVGKDLPLLRDALADRGLHTRPSRCSRDGGTISALPGSAGGGRPAVPARAGQAR